MPNDLHDKKRQTSQMQLVAHADYKMMVRFQCRAVGLAVVFFPYALQGTSLYPVDRFVLHTNIFSNITCSFTLRVQI